MPAVAPIPQARETGGQQGQQWGSRSYLRMLGCERRFISCTSRSMLARLLISLFIFSTMICPDWRCRTWRGVQGRLSPTCLRSYPRHQPAPSIHPSPRGRSRAPHAPKAQGTSGTATVTGGALLAQQHPKDCQGYGGSTPGTAAPQGPPVPMTHIPIPPSSPCLSSCPLHATLSSPPGEATAAPASCDPNPAARTGRCRIGAHQGELFQVRTTQPDATSMGWRTEGAHGPLNQPQGQPTPCWCTTPAWWGRPLGRHCIFSWPQPIAVMRAGSLAPHQEQQLGAWPSVDNPVLAGRGTSTGSPAPAPPQHHAGRGQTNAEGSLLNGCSGWDGTPPGTAAGRGGQPGRSQLPPGTH